jgi:membrane-bound ClpP family serine protease
VKESDVSQSTGSAEKHEAGAFDVRNIIAGLIGLYGIVLVIVGLVDRSSAEMTKTGGVNANLWAGIVMVVVAAAFAAWSRLRPIVVTARPKETDD